MSVILKQFDGGAIAPRDDAILYNSIITRNGILNGCTITHLGANQIKITAGRGIIKGRMFEVEEMTVNCQLASAGTQKGRMYLRMELSNMENPAQIKTVAADTLPELVQEEDCNYTNGIYELELCTYDVTDTLLSNLKTTYEVIDTVFPVAKTLDDVNGVTDEDVLAGALAVKELSSEINDINANNLESAINIQQGTIYTAERDGYLELNGYAHGDSSHVHCRIWSADESNSFYHYANGTRIGLLIKNGMKIQANEITADCYAKFFPLVKSVY